MRERDSQKRHHKENGKNKSIHQQRAIRVCPGTEGAVETVGETIIGKRSVSKWKSKNVGV